MANKLKLLVGYDAVSYFNEHKDDAEYIGKTAKEIADGIEQMLDYHNFKYEVVERTFNSLEEKRIYLEALSLMVSAGAKGYICNLE